MNVAMEIHKSNHGSKSSPIHWYMGHVQQFSIAMFNNQGINPNLSWSIPMDSWLSYGALRFGDFHGFPIWPRGRAGLPCGKLSLLMLFLRREAVMENSCKAQWFGAIYHDLRLAMWWRIHNKDLGRSKKSDLKPGTMGIGVRESPTGSHISGEWSNLCNLPREIGQ